MAGETSKTYTATHVVGASPWDTFELLTDPDQQTQWRDRWARHAQVVEADEYTRVAFDDSVVIELEPDGSGTRLTATRTRSGNGLTGRIGVWFTSRKTVEAELLTLLKRIGNALDYGDI